MNEVSKFFAPSPTLGGRVSEEIVGGFWELQNRLGQDNFNFFSFEHSAHLSQKTLRDDWEVSGEVLSRWRKNELGDPSKGAGGTTTFPINEILRCLYASKDWTRTRLEPFAIDKKIVSTEADFPFPILGSGLKKSSPASGYLDTELKRIVINKMPLTRERLYVALFVRTRPQQDIFPGCQNLPADPVKGIRELLSHFGIVDEMIQPEDVSDDLLNLLDGDLDCTSVKISKSKLVNIATKLAGSEASFIHKCTWLAILMVSLPCGEDTLLDFVNRLIVAQQGQKLSSSAIYSRIGLVRVYLILKAQNNGLPLPKTTAVSDRLRKVADGDLCEVWQIACHFAKSNRRKDPNKEDCIDAWRHFSSELLPCSDNPSQEVDYTADYDEINDRKARSKRAKIGKAINKHIEGTGLKEPEDALLAYLKSLGISQVDTDILMYELLGPAVVISSEKCLDRCVPIEEPEQFRAKVI